MSGGSTGATVTIEVTETCRAAADRVWEVLVDWSAHERWMVLTRAHGGHGVGARVVAFTGIGPLGFRDTMEIVEWRPATARSSGRCGMRHTGRVVRGYGRFDVRPLDAERCAVTWYERIEPPLGRLGRWLWPLGRAAVTPLFGRSLRALGRLAEETE